MLPDLSVIVVTALALALTVILNALIFRPVLRVIQQRNEAAARIPGRRAP